MSGRYQEGYVAGHKKGMKDSAAEIERLRTLVKECLRYMHNDFEPDNQSAVYYRIRRALEGK